MRTTYLVTNREFARTNPVFLGACRLAKVEPTARQASKWRNQQGQAFPQRHKALAALQKQEQAVQQPTTVTV